MSISGFIRDSVLLPRLKAAGCLVVYDAVGRYRTACQDLASASIQVVDVDLRAHQATRNRRAKQADPFALYAECGAVFPQDDGDEYLSLCLRARPDHATEIRQVFAGSPSGPTFAVIDAIGGGVSWPQLRATLRVESAPEILAALLAPSRSQTEALKGQEGWSKRRATSSAPPWA
jgi:hypothetical protein